MFKLALCVLLSLASFTRCAVVPLSSTAVPEVQRGTHSHQDNISEYVAEEIVAEELSEIGAVAQRTGHVLYKLGSELQRAVSDHAIHEEDVASYGYFKDQFAKIKAALKEAATKVKAKVKNATAVLKEKAKIAAAVVKENAKIAAVVVKEKAKHAAVVLKDAAIDAAREAISRMVVEILEMRLRDLLGVHSLDENSTTYREMLLQLSKDVEVLGLELVQKGVELSGGVAVDVHLTHDQEEFVNQVVQALVKP